MRLAVFGIGLVVASLVPSVRAVAGGTQWAGNGHWYEVVRAPAGITWSAAESDAVARGGHLACITSLAEDQFAFGLIDNSAYWHASNGGSNVGPWLGGWQPSGSPEPAGNWKWITDEPFSFSAWASNQPNNTDGNENHIHYVGTGSARSMQWNDLPDIPPGDWYPNSYVVEVVPEPGTASMLGLISALMLGIRRWRKG